MTQIFTRDQIAQAITPQQVIQRVEEGFVLYAQGKVVIAPLSSLKIADAGLAKIKYGYIQDDPYYVIKVGSFFPGNTAKQLPAITASMQIYSKETGEFAALLLDEAYLTNARTAAAGALAVRQFAPKQIASIGIVGTGAQARWQLEYLEHVTDCRSVIIYGRSPDHAAQLADEARQRGWQSATVRSVDELAASCNVIVLATSATEPVLNTSQLRSGVLIVSVGADTDAKQEIDGQVLASADLVIADSKEQCNTLGNIAAALKSKTIDAAKVSELGTYLVDGIGRSFEGQTIVVSLTGVAVQDIEVATLAYERLTDKG